MHLVKSHGYVKINQEEQRHKRGRGCRNSHEIPNSPTVLGLLQGLLFVCFRSTKNDSLQELNRGKCYCEIYCAGGFNKTQTVTELLRP